MPPRARVLALLLGLALGGATTHGAAQDAAPAASSASPVSSVAPGDVSGGPTALPPSHPRLGGGDASAEDRSSPPSDESFASSEVPAGSVTAIIADAQGRPLAGREVSLAILRMTVAEGESSEQRQATTDAAGAVQFTGLPSGSAFSFQVRTRQDGATYSSEPFQLQDKLGQRVLLHVFPVTRDIERALVGARAVVYLEPKDDAFQFEVLLSVFNLGSVTWVPQDLGVRLPAGARAFNAPEGTGGVRFEFDGERLARLTGSFTPGQRDASFRFQIPSRHEPSASFDFQLPPHVAELRVMAEASRGMQLEVQGSGQPRGGARQPLSFDPAEPMQNQRGQRLLVSTKQLRQGDPELAEIHVRLHGIPQRGQGRWPSVLLALSLLAGGVVAALRRPRGRDARRSAEEQDHLAARELLLDELVALERAHAAGGVGPKTYAEARRGLLEALTRIEAAIPPEKQG